MRRDDAVAGIGCLGAIAVFVFAMVSCQAYLQDHECEDSAGLRERVTVLGDCLRSTNCTVTAKQLETYRRYTEKCGPGFDARRP